MNIKETLLNIYGTIVTLFRGFAQLLGDFFRFIVNLLHELPLYEKFFLLFAILQGLFLAKPWRSFTLAFSENHKITQGAMTDDFLWYAIAFTIAGLPTLVILFRKSPETPETRFTFFLRVGGLGIITFFYIATIFDAGRIAPVKEASFTIWFILFGILLPATWVSGVRGVISYAQSS